VTPHPLGVLIAAAASGQFLPVDGAWHRVPPWRPQLEAIVAFTGHAVLAVSDETTDDVLAALGPDGFGGAHDPRLVAALAGPGGWIDSLDVLLARRGTGTAPGASRLVPRPDLAGHPRVLFAREHRDDVRVLGYPAVTRSAVATLSRGVGGLCELSVEVDVPHRGGSGARLIEDAISSVPEGELVVAAAAPGNAASLRALLTAGFIPLGSLQLFRRAVSDRGAWRSACATGHDEV
jgi:hypothetical protein